MAIGVVGLGYVGLPLVVAFAQAGEDVVAVDVNTEKVAAINAGHSYVEDVPSELLKKLQDKIHAGTDFEPLARTEAVIICVPTPLTPNREPDLKPLEASTAAVAKVVQSGQTIVLESTTYPGTTREMLVPALEQASGLRVGENLHVAFSPERVDPGRTDYTLKNTPKVIGGMTPLCTQRAAELYGRVCDNVVKVSTPEAAELTKLLENIFRSVNIALVNEMALVAERMGINIWEVIDAASTKPYGFMRFEPGPGMGGHCLPVDPFYLTWRAREFQMSTEFIELAGKINQQMPYHCVERIELALNDVSKPIRGSKLALLGVAYKGGIGDIRESPALHIIEELQRRGADLVYHDPYVPELRSLGLSSTPLEEAVEGADAVVLVTAHPEINHLQLAEAAPLFVDLRGITRKLADRACIIRLLSTCGSGRRPRWAGGPRTTAGPIDFCNIVSVAAYTGADAITVALVNNMPDGAFLDTEQQFQRTLATAALHHPLELKRYTLPGLTRSDMVKAEIARSYAPLPALYETRPDALIITGTEPVELDLEDEPYWDPLCELLRWAAETVPTTMHSCLTAHASLQLFDGIRRTHVDQKVHGVLTGAVDPDAGVISAGLPQTVSVPHSRLNEVPTEALKSAGYQIAIGPAAQTPAGASVPAGSAGAHHDRTRLAPWSVAVRRQNRSLFVLCQGHLEYYTDSLLREYRRDVRRFLFDRANRTYPPLPLSYFRDEETARLLALRDELEADAETDPLELYRRFPFQDIRANVRNHWAAPAQTIFSNWIELAARERQS